MDVVISGEGDSCLHNEDKNKNWKFSYESYWNWKAEAPFRSICSSRDLEIYDMDMCLNSINLMRKINFKMCRLWNTAGGLLAFNPKDFHVMVTEHFWASCYKTLYKARENFDRSVRKKRETIYISPNIFNIQDTSEKVLTYLICSWECLQELEALLILHKQGAQQKPVTIVRSPIVGIDKIRPVYWTLSHEIVYFQICNCYIINIIKDALERMDKFSLTLRGIDSIDFYRELSENTESRAHFEKKMLNEMGMIVAKPKKLKLGKPSLQTITEELPMRIRDPCVSKLFRQMRSYSTYSSSISSKSSGSRGPAIIDDNLSLNKSMDEIIRMEMEPLVLDKKYSENIQAPISGQPEEPKKQKFFPRLVKMGQRPMSYILQRFPKNIKPFDSLAVVKLANGTKGLI